MNALTKTKKIPLKQWQHEEADRIKVTPATVARYLAQGKYSHLKIERVNPRVIFVIQN